MRNPALDFLSEFNRALTQSKEQVMCRISNVRMGPIEDGLENSFETFYFDFDGETLHARQDGRIKEACLGFGEETDKTIAYRAMVDGHVLGPVER